MNVLPISANYQNRNKISFGTNDYIRKSMVYETQKAKKQVLPEAAKTAVAAIGTIPAIVGIDSILKENKITYFNTDKNIANVAAGYNGGFYSVKLPLGIIAQQRAKEYFAKTLVSKPYSSFGGLKNYINMVNDLKRQDIIQKGLRIHTYELNTDVSLEKKVTAASDISNFLKKQINAEDLFFIENEAFYYDKLTRTAYGLNINARAYSNPINTICEFKTDSRNNVIGYKSTGWDSYQWDKREKEYTEQQKPSPTLAKIANPDNNIDMAEAFRFGNSTIHDNYRVKVGIPKVLEHLTNRVKVPNISESQLHFARFYNSDKEPETRICYFDPTIGRSFVYTAEGKYLHQIEFNKDANGNIFACSKF